ncbi:MAG: DUF4960 domain-containing protein [Bacteroidales bacterium]|nr:DUF4960 domain-containing protein [Bacteroidales bacterium]
MKKISLYILALAAVCLSSCQDKDYECSEMILSSIDASTIEGKLVGDDYILSWPALSNGLQMQVTRYKGETNDGSVVVDGNQYVHSTVNTNIDFTYVLKVTDGVNLSNGSIVKYKREGADMISGLGMSQLDKANGYDAKVEWAQPSETDNIILTADNGKGRTINETISGTATSYIISDVIDGEEWTVTLVAKNAKGSSLSTATSLKIGKTLIGFLGVYATADECVADGDDDEASAWLWLHSEYPTARYVSFSDIESAEDLAPFRVLFWLRDLEGVGEGEVLNMPDVVKAATPAVSEWYKNGGSLLLWSHAMPWVETLGRIPEGSIVGNDHAIGTGEGGWNPDTWKMAVALHPGSRFKKDFSDHPIYRGLEVETTDRTKLIAMKGAGWTEDHNCLFFNYPSALTGIGNQEEACYNTLTEVYGIYPLATWDSQIDWVSQLNIWEARQGDTDFKGTILCVGNGGCEFSLKNADGTPDKSAYPKNNPYQDNVLQLAKNSLEYLKTR